jgi:hypothetical protein
MDLIYTLAGWFSHPGVLMLITLPFIIVVFLSDRR